MVMDGISMPDYETLRMEREPCRRFCPCTTSTCTYRMTLRLNIRSLDFGACVERKVRTSQIEGIPLTIEDVRTLGIVQQALKLRYYLFNKTIATV